ncbi:MAG: hypothetical protein ACJARP_002632 [Vicingaceae bacterium]|jgi:hypothetical protein
MDDDSCKRASVPRLDFKNYAFAGLKTYVKSCEALVLKESFFKEGETLIIRLEFITTRGCNKEYKLHHWYKISKYIITKASDVEFEEILTIIDKE